MFISFESVDNTGKTSIINKIYEVLKEDFTIYKYNEPSNNYFGELAKYGVDGLKSIDLIYLWWTSRKFELNKNKLKDADIVLADRYYDSTFVYGKLYNHSQDMVNHNYDHKYFRKPDITFIFQGYGIQMLKRNDNSIDHYNSLDVNTINSINQKFNILQDIFPERNIVSIDSVENSIDEMFNFCLTTIKQKIIEENFNGQSTTKKTNHINN